MHGSTVLTIISISKENVHELSPHLLIPWVKTKTVYLQQTHSVASGTVRGCIVFLLQCHLCKARKGGKEEGTREGCQWGWGTLRGSSLQDSLNFWQTDSKAKALITQRCSLRSLQNNFSELKQCLLSVRLRRLNYSYYLETVQRLEMKTHLATAPVQSRLCRTSQVSLNSDCLIGILKRHYSRHKWNRLCHLEVSESFMVVYASPLVTDVVPLDPMKLCDKR